MTATVEAAKLGGQPASVWLREMALQLSWRKNAGTKFFEREWEGKGHTLACKREKSCREKDEALNEREKQQKFN